MVIVLRTAGQGCLTCNYIMTKIESLFKRTHVIGVKANFRPHFGSISSFVDKE